MQQTVTDAEAVDCAKRLAAEIQRRRIERLEKQVEKGRRPKTSMWSSQIPECARQGVYDFVEWKTKQLWGADSMARMNQGHIQERALVAELLQDGWEIVEEQSPISDAMRKKYNLSGYIDFKIKWEGKRVPLEIKSMNPNLFQRVNTLEDMVQYHWMRKYLRQKQLYLMGMNEPAGLFFLTDCLGKWKFIPVKFDQSAADASLKMVEEIHLNVSSGTLPPKIKFDSEVCGNCSFVAICKPDIENEGAKFIDDAVALELLQRREQMKPYADDYDSAHEALKEMFKGVPLSVIGDYTVSGKKTTRTSYDIPDDVKKQYATKVEGWKVNIVNAKKQDD